MFNTMKLSQATFAVLLALGFTAQAQDLAAPEEKSPWTHESELSLVTVSGNTESESYSAKQKTTYTFDLNVMTATGRYLQSKTGGTETALAWDAALRYERVLNDWWSIYLGHGAESDKYAGYLQRDNSDIGAKYILRKTETVNWFSELGYRYTTTMPTNAPKYTTNYGRVYTEYAHAVNPTLSFKLWVEYLPNFTDEKAYLINGEPSMSVMLSKIFSLKTGYLVKYQNKPAVAGADYVDTTFTTSLVAKF